MSTKMCCDASALLDGKIIILGKMMIEANQWSALMLVIYWNMLLYTIRCCSSISNKYLSRGGDGNDGVDASAAL